MDELYRRNARKYTHLSGARENRGISQGREIDFEDSE